MGNMLGYFIGGDANLERYLKKGQYLDSGHNGIIYMLPECKILKVFKSERVCKGEYEILQRAGKLSRHFPRVYEHGDYYIVRDYVGGKRLDHYIRESGLCKKLAENLVSLILEFKEIGFSRLDIRCKDIYVQEDLSLIVIDPKKNYTKQVNYPRHLMKGLNNLHVLEEFLQTAETVSQNFKSWRSNMNRYLTYKIK